MWKPVNPPASNQPNSTPAATPTQTKPNAAPAMENSRPAPAAEPTPAPANRNAVLNTQEQATIGKSLVIKGEVTGSESLYIDGKVEGSIQLPGNRVTIGRNGQVSANINAREVVVLGKVRGNLNASDRVDIRNEGSLTGDVVAQRI
jgi:cytoskeletal protein CcmA (bactofilin family)